MGQLVKLKVACKEVALSRSYMYRCARTGKLPCHRAGRAIRFDIDELRAAMKAMAEGEKNGTSARLEQ